MLALFLLPHALVVFQRKQEVKTYNNIPMPSSRFLKNDSCKGFWD